MAAILTRRLAQKAVDIVRPSLESLLGSELVGGRTGFHLVIMNAADAAMPLYEESWGKEDWKRDYSAIAYAKGATAARERMPTGTILNNAPWLFRAGDARFAGGVHENGLTVAGSGFQAYFDSMISWMVLSAIQGLCLDAVAKIPADATSFFE